MHVQDALRSANSQIRMLRAEVAALHEQIDCCAYSGPLTPPSAPSLAPVDTTAAETDTAAVEGSEAGTDSAAGKGEVQELQV